MGFDIVLRTTGETGTAVRLGPFQEARLSHRRVRAGGIELVRHHDGAWHWGADRFFDSRLEALAPVGPGSLHLRYDRAGHREELGRLTDVVRLYGDRLLGSGEEWYATDDDDGHCWVSEDTGLPHDELVVASLSIGDVVT